MPDRGWNASFPTWHVLARVSVVVVRVSIRFNFVRTIYLLVAIFDRRFNQIYARSLLRGTNDLERTRNVRR